MSKVGFIGVGTMEFKSSGYDREIGRASCRERV